MEWGSLTPLVGAAAGALGGALVCYVRLARRLESAAAERAALSAELDAERRGSAEKRVLVKNAEDQLSNAFKALSVDALKSNNQAFLDLARLSLEQLHQGARGDLDLRQQAIGDMLKPVRESLDKVDTRIVELEKARTGAYESLTQQVRGLADTQRELRSETSNLVKALRAPATRGRWGELHLRRVVEMAGMVEHCDFTEQLTIQGEERRLRPDLVIRLPSSRNIVVDAKAPLAAYLEAIEAPDDDTRRARLRDHARQIRTHIAELSKKSYWAELRPTPEFVVLFLPGEMIFGAALEHDPELIQTGAEQRVILATPTTLIALLRAVAYGWQNEKLALGAQQISDLGRELYKRLSDLGDHFGKLGRSLESSVAAYNGAVGSLEGRVMVTARKLKELEAAPADVDLAPLATIDQAVRPLHAVELVAQPRESSDPTAHVRKVTSGPIAVLK